jgi:putative transposase
MSRKGNWWDNALRESVWATLTREWSDRYVFASHQEARTVIFAYQEVFYQRQRIHSSLGYQSPAHFAQASVSSDSFLTP